MRSGRSARIIHRSRRKYAQSEPIRLRRRLGVMAARFGQVACTLEVDGQRLRIGMPRHLEHHGKLRMVAAQRGRGMRNDAV